MAEKWVVGDADEYTYADGWRVINPSDQIVFCLEGKGNAERLCAELNSLTAELAKARGDWTKEVENVQEDKKALIAQTVHLTKYIGEIVKMCDDGFPLDQIKLHATTALNKRIKNNEYNSKHK